MARKRSREQLEEKVRELEKENWVLLHAFNAAARGAIKWLSRKHYDGGTYSFGITTDLDNPILLIKYTYPGQRTTTQARDYGEYKSTEWARERECMTEFYRQFYEQVNGLFCEAERQMAGDRQIAPGKIIEAKTFIADPSILAGIRKVTVTPATPEETKVLSACADELSGCEPHPEGIRK